MKRGNLAVIVWTEGCETPPIMGVITELGSVTRDPTRQPIHLLTDASHLWLERGDLRKVS